MSRSNINILKRFPPVAVASFSVTLVVYSTLAARDVTLVDSGELILAASTLDIAHPPGFPVYTLVGHLFNRLPIGSPAFRLSLMSAFFGALIIGLLVPWLMWILRRSQKRSPQRFHGRPELGVVGQALGAAGMLAVSHSFSFYAAVAEVYTLNTALFVVALIALVRWRRRRLGMPVFGLCLGLGLGVHHVTWVLWMPAFVLYLGSRHLRRSPSFQKAVRCTARDVWRAAPAAALGLLSYAYLPLAASAGPWLGWGDPTTLRAFWWHISAGQYRAYWSEIGWGVVVDGLAHIGHLWLEQWTFAGSAVALIGALSLWRRQRPLLMLLLTGSATMIAYTAAYDIAEDGDAYLLTVFLSTAVCLAVGWQWVLERAGHPQVRTLIRALIIGLIAYLPMTYPGHSGALQLSGYFRAVDRSDDRVARFYVEDVLADVDSGGLVLTKDWQFHAPFLYLHRLEGFRPDVTVVNLNLLRYSWYLDHLDRADPEMTAACATERAAYEALLRRWESGEEVDPDGLTRTFNALIEAMIHHRLPRAEVHVTLPVEEGIATDLFWWPRALTFQLLPGPPTTRRPVPETHWQMLLKEPLQPPADTKLRSVYSFMAEARADFLLEAGLPEEAEKARRPALELARFSSDEH